MYLTFNALCLLSPGRSLQKSLFLPYPVVMMRELGNVGAQISTNHRNLSIDNCRRDRLGISTKVSQARKSDSESPNPFLSLEPIALDALVT
jgi:hypothetical protein